MCVMCMWYVREFVFRDCAELFSGVAEAQSEDMGGSTIGL